MRAPKVFGKGNTLTAHFVTCQADGKLGRALLHIGLVNGIKVWTLLSNSKLAVGSGMSRYCVTVTLPRSRNGQCRLSLPLLSCPVVQKVSRVTE